MSYQHCSSTNCFASERCRPMVLCAFCCAARMVLLAAHRFGVQVPRVRWKLPAKTHHPACRRHLQTRTHWQPIGVLLEAKGFDAVDLTFPQVDREAARSQQRLNTQFKLLLYSWITGLYELEEHMAQIAGRPALGMQ